MEYNLTHLGIRRKLAHFTEHPHSSQQEELLFLHTCCNGQVRKRFLKGHYFTNVWKDGGFSELPVIQKLLPVSILFKAEMPSKSCKNSSAWLLRKFSEYAKRSDEVTLLRRAVLKKNQCTGKSNKKKEQKQKLFTFS